MNKKESVFKYFDIIFSGYKKYGRRPITMMSPYVLYEYMDINGRIAFEHNTEKESITFDYDEFYSVKNMFGISIPDLVDICKEYVANKFDDVSVLKTNFFARNLN
jgi:hypothetical protein